MPAHTSHRAAAQLSHHHRTHSKPEQADFSRAVIRKTSQGQIAVSRTFVLEWLHEEVMVQHSCRSLPFTVVFWIVFVLTQLAHRTVQTSYALQSFTSDQLQKAVPASVTTIAPDGSAIASTSFGIALEDVTDRATIYKWLDEAAIRLAWGGERDNIKYISNFDRVVGGVRIEQRRLKTVECPGRKSIRKLFKPICYSLGKEKNKSALSVSDWQGSRSNKDGLFTYWLDVNQSEAQALSHTQFLKQMQWLGPATDMVNVQTVLFNAQLARALTVKISFELARTGEVSSGIKVKVVPTDAYENGWALVGDIFLLILLIWLGIGEVLSFRQKGCRKYLLDPEISPYAALNWACVIMGIGLSVFYIVSAVSIGKLGQEFADVPVAPASWYQPGSNNWVERHRHLDALYDSVTREATNLSRSEVVTFWYTLLIVVKFFQAFSANPRLSVITETFLKAMGDLLHFLIVFFSIFFNFALGAYILVGSQILEWSTPGRALISSFRVLMGDFNFQAMYDVAPFSATVWFICFMLLIFLVMLNMFVAIILDIYVEVKDGPGSHNKTVMEQMKSLYTGIRIKASSVPQAFTRFNNGTNQVSSLNELHEKLENNREAAITPEELAALGVQPDHAKKLFGHVVQKAKKKEQAAPVASGNGHSNSRPKTSSKTTSPEAPNASGRPAPREREEPNAGLRAAAVAPDAGGAGHSGGPMASPFDIATENREMKLPNTPPPNIGAEGLTGYAKELLHRLEMLQTGDSTSTPWFSAPPRPDDPETVIVAD